jgi:hypothetical protein
MLSFMELRGRERNGIIVLPKKPKADGSIRLGLSNENQPGVVAEGLPK